MINIHIKLDKDTLETLRVIIDRTMSQAQDDLNRASLQYERKRTIDNHRIQEIYGKTFDQYQKVQEFVYSLKADETP